ncbi:hypothetical protein K6119_04010 [Paracrocinitomix mangrovi]|uniref:hypothetical protein n=1 Tax=Paracrocinitomix mangrovi TaxID=2862509 RepID=UPI001C8E23FB|nr:hypothetical protein [Paracrocinitomix mangrovi]UKN02677.1 hypothetical protein K6119_04010 [Paracrocinitomix mangrovi]
MKETQIQFYIDELGQSYGLEKYFFAWLVHSFSSKSSIPFDDVKVEGEIGYPTYEQFEIQCDLKAVYNDVEIPMKLSRRGVEAGSRGFWVKDSLSCKLQDISWALSYNDDKVLNCWTTSNNTQEVIDFVQSIKGMEFSRIWVFQDDEKELYFDKYAEIMKPSYQSIASDSFEIAPLFAHPFYRSLIDTPANLIAALGLMEEVVFKSDNQTNEDYDSTIVFESIEIVLRLKLSNKKHKPTQLRINIDDQKDPKNLACIMLKATDPEKPFYLNQCEVYQYFENKDYKPKQLKSLFNTMLTLVHL